jgi:hypothetical protein
MVRRAREEPKYYTLIVPPNATPGKRILCRVDGKIAFVICPQESGPGSQIVFKL